MDLKLKELEFVRIEEETEKETEIKIEVRQLREGVDNCPHCKSTNLKKYGHARMRYFKDLPMKGKYVKIGWKRQNYMCKDCSKTFFQKISDIGNKNITVRLKEEVFKLAKTTDFSNYKIGRIVGLNEKSIRRFKQELLV